MKPKIGDIITLYRASVYNVTKVTCEIIDITDISENDPYNKFYFMITCNISRVSCGKEIRNKGIHIFTKDFITYRIGCYEPFGEYHLDKTKECKKVINNIANKMKELERRRAEVLKVFYLG